MFGDSDERTEEDEETSLSDEEEEKPVRRKSSGKSAKGRKLASEQGAISDDGLDTEDEDEAGHVRKSVLKKLDPEREALPWYALHTYSGYEKRVQSSLEERMRSANLESRFGNIVVPQETVEELVRGKKKQSSRKLFPGYIMVQMHLDDETWHLVNSTPKVTGFVGDARTPLPLTAQEAKDMLAHLEGGTSRPRPRVQFEEGDAIKVIDGPFSDFNGTVDEVRADKGKLRVLISIFGRNTPVELDFVQVEKL